MNKSAQNNHPIHPLLKERWSPRAFTEQPVQLSDLLSLFEAARWSPSGGNLQPWAYVVTTIGTAAHQNFVEILSPGNQTWAKFAPVLVLTLAQRDRGEGKPNPWALYDLGQASAHLTFQAAALGLSVHQMGGYDKTRAREVFVVPDEYETGPVIAIGYAGSPDSLPEDLQAREAAVRTRKALETFVFANTWKEPVQSSEPVLSNN